MELTGVTLARTCRACGSQARAKPFFSLGQQPLANRYLTREELEQPEPTAPLAVWRCGFCALSQLTHVVAPEVLYNQYAYQSGVSQGWGHHCTKLVTALKVRRPKARFLIDIASNDGTLLGIAAQAGFQVRGVEPAQNLAHACPYPVTNAFWSPMVAGEIAGKDGLVDIIVAQNVFGHVNDAAAFLRGIVLALAPTGIAIIECPDALQLLTQGLFDTIYHEHLSYWTLSPLMCLAEMCGLHVIDVEPVPVHGGSLRYWLAHHDQHTERPSIAQRLRAEQRGGLGDGRLYKRFNIRVSGILDTIASMLVDSKALYAYGASAKGNVLLNALAQRGTKLPAVVADDSPLKQERFTPGTHLPTGKVDSFKNVDTLLLLPWNWASELIARARERGFTGRFLIPLPEPRWE